MSAVAQKFRVGSFAVRRPRMSRLIKRVWRFRTLLEVVGGAVPASLIAIVLFLILYAWPAIVLNGWGFIGGSEWNLGNAYDDPVLTKGVSVLPGAHYAILFLIGGTLLTTLIALAIAAPVGVGAAIFLAEAVPSGPRLWLSLFVELLAAIPSVVFGLWGYAVLIPLIGRHVAPLMSRWLGFIPFFGGSPGNGYGLLTAGLVLSLMIVPLITVTLRDAIVREPELAARKRSRAWSQPLRDDLVGDHAWSASGFDRRLRPRDWSSFRRDDGGADGERQCARDAALERLRSDQHNGVFHRFAA